MPVQPWDHQVETVNTSGQGKGATVPLEVQGWNWAALLLNWIWGIGNGVWISLLSLLPVGNVVMPIVLGAKGNAWAWQKKRWDSTQHFKKTQRTWTIVAVSIWIPITLLTISVLVISAVLEGSFGDGEPMRVTASNGAFAMTVPGDWEVLPELHAQAEIEVGDVVDETYVITLSDAKADVVGLNLPRFAQDTRTSLMGSLASGRVTGGPREMQLGGRPAIQAEVRGTDGNVNIVYLHTSVDGPEHFIQVIAWTFPSTFDAERSTLQTVISSLEFE